MKIRALMTAAVVALAFGGFAKDVYLLVGQSNMAGRGRLSDDAPIPNERIEKLDNSGKWVPATEPLHYSAWVEGGDLTCNTDRIHFDTKSVRTLGQFYNRLCGFDGQPPLIRKETLDAALKPCRHPSDPLPSAVSMKRDWFMLFGMGYGLWGEAERMDRVFGHGDAGGSEALVDRDQRLIVAFTCNFCKNCNPLRDRLYEAVGLRWRYWNGGVNIQDLQMTTSSGGSFGAGITSH